MTTVSALLASNVNKIYPNGLQALHNLNLDVRKGDFFALLGPNGAGKSTFINIVSQLVATSSGNISIFGHDLQQDSLAAKLQLGLVPQEYNFNIFETVEQVILNVAGFYGIRISDAKTRCLYLLKKLDLVKKRNNIIKELSGGMKRRLMIARALIHQPKLLILDEPTAGVDVEQRQIMWEFLQEINQTGTTIILTTHYLEEAERLCSKLAIINHGKLAMQTNMADILTDLRECKYELQLNVKPNTQLLDDMHSYRPAVTDNNTAIILQITCGVTHSLNHALQLINTHKSINIIAINKQFMSLEQKFLEIIK